MIPFLSKKLSLINNLNGTQSRLACVLMCCCYSVLQDPVVDHSLSCLKNSTSDMSNTYATALLAYTFTLAGDMETRARLLQHLDTMSFQEGELYLLVLSS